MVSADKIHVARYLRSKGKTWSEIADEVKESVSTIFEACQRGVERKARKAPRGQTRRLNQRRKWLVEIADTMETFTIIPGKTGRAQPKVITRRKFNTAAKCRAELFRRHGIKICVQTVRNDLAEEGLFAYTCPWGPVRKENDAKSRTDMCSRILSSGHPWAKYVFVDEKYANNNEHGRTTELRRQGDTPTHRQRERFAPTIHVFGAIAVGFRKLVVLPKGGIDAPAYKRRCLQPIAPFILANGCILVQDGAKPHAAEAKQYLENKNIEFLVWAARSPDLNPIERIWAWIQYQVSLQPPPANEDELARLWQQEWDAISQASIDRLCMEFQDYLRECKSKDGQTIISTRAMKKKWQPLRD